MFTVDTFALRKRDMKERRGIEASSDANWKYESIHGMSTTFLSMVDGFPGRKESHGGKNKTRTGRNGSQKGERIAKEKESASGRAGHPKRRIHRRSTKDHRSLIFFRRANRVTQSRFLSPS